MNSFSSSKMLLPCIKSVIQLMALIAFPPIHCCFVRIAHDLYIDDEVVESDGLDE